MSTTPEHELVCDGGEDVPQRGGPFTDRQKTGIYLFASVIIICLLSIRVGALLGWAWDGYGMGRSVVVSLVTEFNIDIDLIVIFFSGLVSGWLALFALFDQTKRLQRFPAVLVSSILAIWIWRSRWHVGVAWGEFWYIAVVGVVVGVITGSRFLTRRSEFPPAAIGLFLTATTLSIIALFDVHLFATEQFSIQNSSIFPSPTSLAGATLNVVSTTGFVGLFGWFTLYSDYRSVAVLTTSPGCGVAVMAKLLDHVQREYNGTSLSGGPTLQRYKQRLGSLEDDTLPSNRYEIKYLPSHSSRWTHISAAPINIYNFNEKVNERIANYINDSSRIRSTFLFGVENILPTRIKRILESNSGLLIAKMSDADILMFVTSVTDADDLPQEGINRFVNLCEGIEDSKQRVVVVTHPHDKMVENAVRNQLDVNNNQFEIVMLGHNAEGDVEDITQLRRAIDN